MNNGYMDDIGVGLGVITLAESISAISKIKNCSFNQKVAIFVYFDEFRSCGGRWLVGTGQIAYLFVQS